MNGQRGSRFLSAPTTSNHRSLTQNRPNMPDVF
jgi:hypothetical protein